MVQVDDRHIQLQLLPLTARQWDDERPRTIAEQFEAFHQDNPHVYLALVRLAMDLVRRGVRQYSINGLFEILRWQYALQTRGEPYRLNNNYRALYARLLMREVPALDGFFETRARRSEGIAT